MSSKAPENNGKADQWQKPPQHEWTVLLYMAGDNNLSEECVYSLTEIKEALTDDKGLKVVAQFDPSGLRAGTKRFELHSMKTTLDEDVIWETRETDTGEPHNLLEFIRWGILTYPAKHYMVVLVGHGTGTDDDFLRDENPASSLSILEFQEVFAKLTADGHTIDILGMDTCLMSMAEVCYEMFRKNVTYLVGSEGFAPNTGWPYRAIVSALTDKITSGKGADPKSLATTIVDEYQRFYRPYINGGISVDQSVLEVAHIEGVQQKMFSLVRTLREEFARDTSDKPEFRNALILAHWEAQSYNGELFVDLYDFCELLQQRYPNDKVIRDCDEVKQAIKKLVVKSNVAGAAFQFSFGLSLYFPWAALSPHYGNLSFPKVTNWIDFLKLYLNKTRRPGRKPAPTATAENAIPPFPQSVLGLPPVRATTPTNKGRSGNVESMRNPPIEEFVGTNIPLPVTEGTKIDTGFKTERRPSTTKKEDGVKEQAAQAGSTS